MPIKQHSCRICGKGYSGFFSWFKAYLCERQGSLPEQQPKGIVFNALERTRDNQPILFVLVGYNGVSPNGHLPIAEFKTIHHSGGEYFGRWIVGIFKNGVISRDGNEVLFSEGERSTEKPARAIFTGLAELTKLKSDPSLARLLGD